MDSLESFRTVEKTSGQFGKFSDNHVICCSVFRQSGIILHTFVYVVKTFYALLANIYALQRKFFGASKSADRKVEAF